MKDFKEKWNLSKGAEEGISKEIFKVSQIEMRSVHTTDDSTKSFIEVDEMTKIFLLFNNYQSFVL